LGDENEMFGARSTYGGEERGVAKYGWEIEGKRALGRPRHRWEDNIKTDLQAGVGVGAWTGSVWLRKRTGGGLL
jgi:hypothetical protein